MVKFDNYHFRVLKNYLNSVIIHIIIILPCNTQLYAMKWISRNNQICKMPWKVCSIAIYTGYSHQLPDYDLTGAYCYGIYVHS